jgi:endoglucanase
MADKNHSNLFYRHRIFTSIIVLVFAIPSFSVATTVDRIVDVYGHLRVDGNRIVNQKGDPIVLRGMSLFWSQWIGKYYNDECMQWLRDDWRCTVIRAAMAVESGGYLTNPVTEMTKIRTVIEACIDLGIYVIVDWHDHNAQNHQDQAIAFFKELATEYGNYPNLIYEIYNEPLQVNWNTVIKPYAEAVIAEIRAIDPDNIIVVGNSTWSQDVDVVARDPIAGVNLAYALHFYAATHKQWLRDKATFALNKGIALWVTEFGTCESSGSGVLDYAESKKWFDFMDANMLSWCNWSIADKVETSAALKPGASETGNWAPSDLTESGILVRDKIIAWNEAITAIEEPISTDTKINFLMLRNYPNPFNPVTEIIYQLPVASHATLTVYDMLGKQVVILVKEVKQAGNYSTSFDGSRLANGIYCARLVAIPLNDSSQDGKPFIQTIKMLLTK